jgi:hypothetical protein
VTITLLIGLPGSGKTYLGNKLSQETGAVFIDDIKSTNQLSIPFAANKDIIIADMALCSTNTRLECIRILELMAKEANIVLIINKIFFENNPQKCLANVEYRNDGRLVKNAILMAAKEYAIDNDVTPVTIWESTCQK